MNPERSRVIRKKADSLQAKQQRANKNKMEELVIIGPRTRGSTSAARKKSQAATDRPSSQNNRTQQISYKARSPSVKGRGRQRGGRAGKLSQERKSRDRVEMKICDTSRAGSKTIGYLAEQNDPNDAKGRGRDVCSETSDDESMASLRIISDSESENMLSDEDEIVNSGESLFLAVSLDKESEEDENSVPSSPEPSRDTNQDNIFMTYKQNRQAYLEGTRSPSSPPGESTLADVFQDGTPPPSRRNVLQEENPRDQQQQEKTLPENPQETMTSTEEETSTRATEVNESSETRPPPTENNPTLVTELTGTKFKLVYFGCYPSGYTALTALEKRVTGLDFRVETTLGQDMVLVPKDPHTENWLARLNKKTGNDPGFMPLDPQIRPTTGVIRRYPAGLPLEAIRAHPNVKKADWLRNKGLRHTCPVLVVHIGPLPSHLDLGKFWGTFPLEEHVKEPVRCYKCQRFGHVQSRCGNDPRCGVCSLKHPSEVCIKKHQLGQSTRAKCINCGRSHHAWSVRCEERHRRTTKLRKQAPRQDNQRQTPTVNYVDAPIPDNHWHKRANTDNQRNYPSEMPTNWTSPNDAETSRVGGNRESRVHQETATTSTAPNATRHQTPHQEYTATTGTKPKEQRREVQRRGPAPNANHERTTAMETRSWEQSPKTWEKRNQATGTDRGEAQRRSPEANPTRNLHPKDNTEKRYGYQPQGSIRQDRQKFPQGIRQVQSPVGGGEKGQVGQRQNQSTSDKVDRAMDQPVMSHHRAEEPAQVIVPTCQVVVEEDILRKWLGPIISSLQALQWQISAINSKLNIRE